MSAPLVADLHAHYPMHVVAGDREATLQRMTRVRGRQGLRERLQGAALWVASRLFNYPRLDAGPRVTIDFLDAGGVRVALLGAVLAVRRIRPRRALRRSRPSRATSTVSSRSSS